MSFWCCDAVDLRSEAWLNDNNTLWHDPEWLLLMLHRLELILVWRRLELWMTGSFLLVSHRQDLLAWYGLGLISNYRWNLYFLEFFHICRICCLASQSHSDGKCRSTFDVFDTLATSPDDLSWFGLGWKVKELALVVITVWLHEAKVLGLESCKWQIFCHACLEHHNTKPRAGVCNYFNVGTLQILFELGCDKPILRLKTNLV